MTDDRRVTDAASTDPEDTAYDELVFDPAAPVVAGPQPIGYDEFGMRFMNLVLHRDRVMESVNRVLGEDFRLRAESATIVRVRITLGSRRRCSIVRSSSSMPSTRTRTTASASPATVCAATTASRSVTDDRRSPGATASAQ